MPNSTSMYNTNVYTGHMWRIESEGFEGQLIYKCDYHTINYSTLSTYAFLFTYIGIPAQDFLWLTLYRHTYHALKFKKNISFVLDTAGDLPGAPIDRFLIHTIFTK
jgi:hypothetical protein